MANAATDWPFWLAAAILAITALGLLYWSLLHNRSRGRKRCPKCWYDMRGADAARKRGLVCPECGRDAKRERRLFKTRRRWGWALLALALAASAYGVYLTPQVRRDGLLKSIPTTALIVMLPWLDQPPTDEQTRFYIQGPGPYKPASFSESMFFELVRRVRGQSMAGGPTGKWPVWQHRLVWRRAAQAERVANNRGRIGDCDAMLLDMWHCRRKDDVADRLLREMLVMRSVRSRVRWPSGELVWYRVDRVPSPLRAEQRVITVRPRVEGSETATYGIGAGPRYATSAARWGVRDDLLPSDALHRIGVLPDGQHRLRFDVTVTDDGRTVWSGPVWREVVVGGAVDSILSPVVSNAIDDSLKKAPVSIARCEESGRAALLIELWKSEPWLAPHPTVMQLLQAQPVSAAGPIVIGCRLELLRDEAPVECFGAGGAPSAAAFEWARVTDNPRGSSAPAPLSWMIALQSSVPWDSDGGRFELRISSDPTTALRDLASRSFWDGEVVLPVSVETYTRQDFDARFKVGEYLLPGAVDPWADE